MDSMAVCPMKIIDGFKFGVCMVYSHTINIITCATCIIPYVQNLWVRKIVSMACTLYWDGNFELNLANRKYSGTPLKWTQLGP